VEAAVQSDLGAFDAGLRITLESAALPEQVWADADAAVVVGLLASQHHGVLAMSPAIAGLVQTSTNLAIVRPRTMKWRSRPASAAPSRAAKRRPH